MDRAALLDRLDAALPQTQCRRCGYADCRAYAEAIADGEAINRCPPGGAEGVRRLAAISGRPPLALDADCGSEAPRRVARVDEAACIGCTLCMQACPVDAIAGAPRRMHSVVADWCTGCELCLPPCPTDCIAMLALPALGPATGWQAWSAEQADAARQRYRARRQRLEAAGAAPTASPTPPDPQRIRAALERARQRQSARPA